MQGSNIMAGLAQGLSGALQNQQVIQENDRKRHLEAAEQSYRAGDLDGVQRSLGAAGINVDLSFARQQREQQAQDRERQLADHTRQVAQQGRQTALQDYQHAQSLMPGLLKANPTEAARVFNSTMGGLKAAGLPSLNPVVGAMRQVPQGLKPRPVPEMQGPMPQIMKAVQTVNNPQTVAYMRSGLNLPGPVVKVTPYGNGGLLQVTQEPDGTVSTLVLREPTTKKPSVVYEDDTVQEDGTIVRKRPAKKAAAPKASKPKYIWKRDKNGKQIRVLDTAGVVSEPAPEKKKKSFFDDDDAPAAKPAAADETSAFAQEFIKTLKR